MVFKNFRFWKHKVILVVPLFTLLLFLLSIFRINYNNFENADDQSPAAFQQKLVDGDQNEDTVEDRCTEMAAEEITRRIHRVRNFCEMYHLGNFEHPSGLTKNDLNVKDPPTPQYSYFFLNREKNLAWCPVYKAGSTSWLHNMMLMAGVSEAALATPPKQLSIWAREIYGEPVPGDDFENAEKMLIVRHPFRRILSAYLDKLSNSSTGLQHGAAHFYLKYGQHIVKKYRLDSTIDQKEPTFEEFVRYLLNTDLVQYSDDHWLPVYYSCTPCRVDYTFIATVETFISDQRCIIETTRLSSILKPKWRHKTKIKSNGKESIVRKYFSELTKSQIQQLYEKYKLDFILFGYTYSSYFKFAKDKEN